jgi:four helix bundle protein
MPPDRCLPCCGREAAEQLLSSSNSVASNHRPPAEQDPCRVTAKIGVVLEEVDESQHWLQHVERCRLADSDRIAPLLAEATELVAIFTSSVKTAREREDERRRRGPRRRPGNRDNR